MLANGRGGIGATIAPLAWAPLGRVGGPLANNVCGLFLWVPGLLAARTLSAGSRMHKIMIHDENIGRGKHPKRQNTEENEIKLVPARKHTLTPTHNCSHILLFSDVNLLIMIIMKKILLSCAFHCGNSFAS